jgi:hypothetical protein
MEPPPQLDLRPYLDLYGTKVYEGDNIICMHRQLQRFPPMERDINLDALVKDLRRGGWDARRLPYDSETNPEMEKINVVVYKVNNALSRTP